MSERFGFIPRRTLALVALALLGAAGPALAADPKVLNVYNWSDYIADETIKNFEKETGIKVNYDNYDTNEVLQAKLVERFGDEFMCHAVPAARAVVGLLLQFRLAFEFVVERR